MVKIIVVEDPKDKLSENLSSHKDLFRAQKVDALFVKWCNTALPNVYYKDSSGKSYTTSLIKLVKSENPVLVVVRFSHHHTVDQEIRLLRSLYAQGAALAVIIDNGFVYNNLTYSTLTRPFDIEDICKLIPVPAAVTVDS